MKRIILFDGVCNLCNNSVQFIIKRDPNGYFSFASLQGNVGQNCLKRYGIPQSISSFVLIEDENFYLKSTAALRVCKNLIWPWKMLCIFQIVPRPLRDFFYDIVAKNRLKWFGKKDSCILPSPEMKNRFLD